MKAGDLSQNWLSLRWVGLSEGGDMLRSDFDVESEPVFWSMFSLLKHTLLFRCKRVGQSEIVKCLNLDVFMISDERGSQGFSIKFLSGLIVKAISL